MRQIAKGAVGLLAVLSLPAQAQDGRPDYVPFPEGFGYFEDPWLPEAVEADDRAALRMHGWALFAGIMQPLDNGWPMWISWPTGTQAFADEDGPSDNVLAVRVSPNVAKGNLPDPQDAPKVNTPSPNYPVPDAVIAAYPDAIKYDDKGNASVKDGAFFASNGDIMIATESFSSEGFEAIREEGLYKASVLAGLKGENVELPDRYVSTKHMYWPVKGDGVTGLPWYADQYDTGFTGYWGYETWDSIVALDPSGMAGGTAEVSLFYGIENNDGSRMETKTVEAPVVPMDAFYHRQITQADWDMFHVNDKAIINAASHWLYGEDFGPGDYLVTVAMHVFTKELPSWTLQSAWWVAEPDAGIYATDRPDLPDAQGPWDHYLLTQGTQTQPGPDGELPISVNPYIEGVIHPIATSCRNCHQRAGTPFSKHTQPGTSYQTDACPDLLAPYGPESACFKGVTLTDFAWIIPDRAQ